MDTRTIMYIGSKRSKYDAPNGDLGRVWPGTGTLVSDIPMLQAAKLLRHPDEFVDVTELDPEQLRVRAQQAIAEVDEKRRRAMGAGTSAEQTLLRYATDEQLEAELARRRAAAGLLGDVKRHSAPTQAEQNLAELSKTPNRSDEQFIKARLPEAIDAILMKADPDLLDDNGLPMKTALEEQLGYPLTEEEYRQALDLPADAA